MTANSPSRNLLNEGAQLDDGEFEIYKVLRNASDSDEGVSVFSIR